MNSTPSVFLPQWPVMTPPATVSYTFSKSNASSTSPRTMSTTSLSQLLCVIKQRVLS